MTIAACIIGGLGLLLALLISFAAGMQTVPRDTTGNALAALPLPLIAILLAVIGLTNGGEGFWRILGNGRLVWEASIRPHCADGSYELADKLLTLSDITGTKHRFSVLSGERVADD